MLMNLHTFPPFLLCRRALGRPPVSLSVEAVGMWQEVTPVCILEAVEIGRSEGVPRTLTSKQQVIRKIGFPQ